jgi:hypothetical protein
VNIIPVLDYCLFVDNTFHEFGALKEDYKNMFFRGQYSKAFCAYKALNSKFCGHIYAFGALKVLNSKFCGHIYAFGASKAFRAFRAIGALKASLLLNLIFFLQRPKADEEHLGLELKI